MAKRQSSKTGLTDSTLRAAIKLLECSRSSRQTPTSSRGAFKRLGTDAAKMAVAAGSVVERLDVVEDIGAR